MHLSILGFHGGVILALHHNNTFGCLYGGSDKAVGGSDAATDSNIYAYIQPNSILRLHMI